MNGFFFATIVGGMHIVHIASEFAPLAKVGGLADVLYGLSKEMAQRGHQVDIILPKYDCLQYPLLKDLKAEFRELWSYDGPYRYHNTIWAGTYGGLKILLLEPHHPAFFFSRGMIYGCNDDIDRFVYFSRAALEYLFKTGKKPDIIHIHDWPTALVAPLYRDMYVPLGFRAGGIVLTIHNLAHQGKCTPINVTRSGLRGEDYLVESKMQDPFQPHLLNLLKGGIEYSDFITTVSPNYEREIKTHEGGFGLDPLLLKHQNKLKGILNGIDQEYWSPEKDPYLPVKGKEANKAALRKRLGLKESVAPLVCSVTRLVPQKGPELIMHALKRTLEKGAQFILLGGSPTPELDKLFHQAQKDLAKNKNVAFHLDYNEELAHLTYAGSDMIIIPSITEPCGLTQMIAQRYGTVPLVRSTGGLADTVFDVDTSKRPEEERNGFVFDFPDTSGVNWVLDRALECYTQNPSKWQKVATRCLSKDFSWNKSADEYLKIYKKLIKQQPS